MVSTLRQEEEEEVAVVVVVVVVVVVAVAVAVAVAVTRRVRPHAVGGVVGVRWEGTAEGGRSRRCGSGPMRHNGGSCGGRRGCTRTQGNDAIGPGPQARQHET